MADNIYTEIFRRYIDYFYTLNDEEHREYFKRETVRHFKDCWDSCADDFPQMIKESIYKESSVFLDDKYNSPASGMVKLVSHPEAVPEVKSLFSVLFSDDGGNIDKRQEHIEEFYEGCNRLLDIYEPGKWKYKQSFRTGLAYLTFFDPSHNYFYKATEAHQMAEMLQFGSDIGRGRSFSLKNYYRMCDLLVDRVRQCDELMEMNRKLVEEINASQPELPLCDYDEEHLLVFDIIWAGKYKIYSDLYYSFESKHVADCKNPNASRISELNQQMEEQKELLDNMLLERSGYDSFSAVGIEVVHRLWGNGRIVEQDGNRISVQLDEEIKEFQIPGAFISGFLNTDDIEVKDIMLQIAELDKKIANLKNALITARIELDNLRRK